MITLRETVNNMRQRPEHATLALMDFVDDFRRRRDLAAISEPFSLEHERFDAMAASTAERLCDEIGAPPPSWRADVPACTHPWFVSGLESLKAIAIVESPARFRVRKIFVLENFLSRA